MSATPREQLDAIARWRDRGKDQFSPSCKHYLRPGFSDLDNAAAIILLMEKAKKDGWLISISYGTFVKMSGKRTERITGFGEYSYYETLTEATTNLFSQIAGESDAL